jgi:hypothetical protein
MSQPLFITPTTDDPESVRAAYRAAIQAGGLERIALQTLADIVRSGGSCSEIRAAEEELAHAERRHDKAEQAYTTARDAATHSGGMDAIEDSEDVTEYPVRPRGGTAA